MTNLFAQPSRRAFVLRTALPIFAVALAVNCAAALLLVWATDETDRASVARQQSLVQLIVSQLRSGIAHDQESSTVWDDAVEGVRRHDMQWIDNNLGSWMVAYFDHDGAYVIDPSDRPIYAYADGAVREPDRFEDIRAATLPLMANLRERLRAGDTEGLSDRILSLGAADVAVVSGRPALISVKPIVSDSGEIEQVAGDEYLHVAVRFLDGGLLTELQDEYLLDGVHFAWTDALKTGEAAEELQTHDGHTVGYLVWRPFRPGTKVLSQVGPIMAAVSLAGLIALGLLIAALRRRSLKLSFSEAAVRHLAHHDLLTGLMNRAQFTERLNGALGMLRDDDMLAVLYLDLDHFKEVNDTLGHPAGDQLLREFSDRLRHLTTSRDTIARFGGDEFVILRLAQSQAEVEALCESIVAAARHPFDLPGSQIFVGVSIGLALAPRDGRDGVELARRADVALYQAKRSGRNRYAIYSSDMDQAAQSRRVLEQDLRRALATTGQLELHYQPLLNLRNDSISGAEALLRWNHPVKGAIPPAVFIPLAEETGLIEQVDDWVLREACRQAANWAPMTLAVNVSITELQNPNFALRVTKTLLASGFDPTRLEMEVTESAFSEHASECEHNIKALRDFGVRFAMDDFGTGFSSLGRLHRLAVDRLKIDRSFIQGLGKDGDDAAIVQAIVGLAHAVGLRTTAEGVETDEQRAYLAGIGCDELQGFLIAKPMPAPAFEEFCRVQGGGAVPVSLAG